MDMITFIRGAIIDDINKQFKLVNLNDDSNYIYKDFKLITSQGRTISRIEVMDTGVIIFEQAKMDSLRDLRAELVDYARDKEELIVWKTCPSLLVTEDYDAMITKIKAYAEVYAE